MKHPNPSARAAASALATLSLLLSTTGCASSGDAPPEAASSTPAASTSQIDEPTASPAEATEPAQAGEVDDINQLECVGDTFVYTFDDSTKMVGAEEAQAAFDCVQAAGQVEITTGIGKGIGGYVFAGEIKDDDTYYFRLSNDQENPEFGTLLVTKGLS